MAKKNDTRFFENKLLDFVAAQDPLLEMLQWMMDKFMEIEVARKTGTHLAGSRREVGKGHESIETTRIYLRRTASEQQEIVDTVVTW